MLFLIVLFSFLSSSTIITLDDVYDFMTMTAPFLVLQFTNLEGANVCVRTCVCRGRWFYLVRVEEDERALCLLLPE